MAKSNKLVIWGASGHALVVADIIRLSGIYEIAGFIDDVNVERHKTGFHSFHILGGREQLDIVRRKGVEHIIFGFGDSEARLNLTELVHEKGFTLITAIHPRSVVADDVKIGQGTVIAAGAVINPCTSIGENVIVNTSASVDHECVIDDGVHICPGVHLGGRVTVGRSTWVGIGAVVKDRVRIGAGSLIGAGSVVVTDIPEGVVAYGVPSKIVKVRTKSG
jgi:UDP-N-acetylbacillosamine N-acetyltransferase